MRDTNRVRAIFGGRARGDVVGGALALVVLGCQGPAPGASDAAATKAAPKGADAPAPAAAKRCDNEEDEGDELGPLDPIAPTTLHDYSVLDLLGMDRLSQARVSPDGANVVYTLRQTDMKHNKARRSLWVMPVAGGEPRRLTAHPKGDSDPRWAPDGNSILFVSKRSGSSQVWRIPTSGGAPTQITNFPVGVSGLVLSRDGSRLAVTAELFPDCDSLSCTAKRTKEKKDDKVSGESYDRVFVRHWDTWKDGRRAHLLVAPTETTAPVGEATIVTRGFDADVPSKPFGGSEEYTFSPDGAQLVFTARVSGKTEPWSTNFDLYAAPADGSAAPRNLTSDNPAWDTHPVFSPDGKTLYHVAMKRAGYEADRFRLVARAWPDGAATVITEGWDRSVRDMVIEPDGASALVIAQDTGNTPLFRIALPGGEVTKLVGDGTVSGPARVGERLLFRRNDLGHPDELWTSALDGSDVRALSHVNDERVKNARTGEAEQFSFPGWNGETVYGWAVKPAQFKEGERYPLAFLIHGGPQGSFGNRYHYRWNPQTYAGAGYAAVMIDFHGSTGYGQAFTDAIRGDWGGKPLEDLQKGLAAALAKYKWIDGDKSCALGASYGGFMINWIAGNWSDRFRCLVNHDGIFDNRMMYYATEELWFPEWEHGGPHYDNPAGYEKHNPVNHVLNWKTPMLVIHGTLDYRVPVEQGLATFNALQRRGIESELLHFPDENHWVLQPNNSKLWHDAVGAWLDGHLKK